MAGAYIAFGAFLSIIVSQNVKPWPEGFSRLLAGCMFPVSVLGHLLACCVFCCVWCVPAFSDVLCVRAVFCVYCAFDMLCVCAAPDTWLLARLVVTRAWHALSFAV